MPTSRRSSPRRHARAVRRKSTPFPRQRGARGGHGHGSRQARVGPAGRNRAGAKKLATRQGQKSPAPELQVKWPSFKNPFGVIGRAKKGGKN